MILQTKASQRLISQRIQYRIVGKVKGNPDVTQQVLASSVIVGNTLPASGKCTITLMMMA